MCGVGEKGKLTPLLFKCKQHDLTLSFFYSVADRRPIDPPRKLLLHKIELFRSNRLIAIVQLKVIDNSLPASEKK